MNVHARKHIGYVQCGYPVGRIYFLCINWQPISALAAINRNLMTVARIVDQQIVLLRQLGAQGVERG